ncbi:tyrosine-type recombinase/integrase [Nonomuraea lactucae]|uniref:tyrosine-type recombinase/integrase n=1 Tax=Nonomuraea lactucae TaxID=2249762 RepID=UPI001F06C768|nr:tyrosine-type recombinase/integrase [Nonomuraea lactucae]
MTDPTPALSADTGTRPSSSAVAPPVITPTGANTAGPTIATRLAALAALPVAPQPEDYQLATASLRDPYDAYLASLESPESRRTQAGCLDRIARLLQGAHLDDKTITGQGQPWWLLRYEHTIHIRRLLTEQGWADRYVNRHLTALRRVLEEAWRLGLMNSEDYQRARSPKNIKSQRKPAGAYIPDEVIGAILAACEADNCAAGARDMALVAVLDSCGLRRAEAANLEMSDYNNPVTGMLRVIGKGNKERHLPLNSFVTRSLERWLTLRGDRPGALFPRLERNGAIRRRNGRPAHMQPQGIADILDKRCRQAGTRRVRPHDVRRSFISNVLPVVDAIKAAKLAGHARPETTMGYDLRPDRELLEDMERLRTPPVRPLHPPAPAGDGPSSPTLPGCAAGGHYR